MGRSKQVTKLPSIFWLTWLTPFPTPCSVSAEEEGLNFQLDALAITVEFIRSFGMVTCEPWSALLWTRSFVLPLASVLETWKQHPHSRDCLTTNKSIDRDINASLFSSPSRPLRIRIASHAMESSSRKRRRSSKRKVKNLTTLLKSRPLPYIDAIQADELAPDNHDHERRTKR